MKHTKPAFTGREAMYLTVINGGFTWGALTVHREKEGKDGDVYLRLSTPRKSWLVKCSKTGSLRCLTP